MSYLKTERAHSLIRICVSIIDLLIIGENGINVRLQLLFSKPFSKRPMFELPANCINVQFLHRKRKLAGLEEPGGCN